MLRADCCISASAAPRLRSNSAALAPWSERMRPAGVKEHVLLAAVMPFDQLHVPM